jgi:hypothetical protein
MICFSSGKGRQYARPVVLYERKRDDVRIPRQILRTADCSAFCCTCFRENLIIAYDKMLELNFLVRTDDFFGSSLQKIRGPDRFRCRVPVILRVGPGLDLL